MKYDLTLSEHNAPSTLAGGVTNTAMFTRHVPGPQARPTPSCAFKEWLFLFGGSKRNNQLR